MLKEKEVVFLGVFGWDGVANGGIGVGMLRMIAFHKKLYLVILW